MCGVYILWLFRAGVRYRINATPLSVWSVEIIGVLDDERKVKDAVAIGLTLFFPEDVNLVCGCHFTCLRMVATHLNNRDIGKAG